VGKKRRVNRKTEGYQMALRLQVAFNRTSEIQPIAVRIPSDACKLSFGRPSAFLRTSERHPVEVHCLRCSRPNLSGSCGAGIDAKPGNSGGDPSSGVGAGFPYRRATNAPARILKRLGSGAGVHSNSRSSCLCMGARLWRAAQKPTNAAAGLFSCGFPEVAHHSRHSLSNA